MGIWDEGKRVRWSPGSKLKPCKHDPKLRDSLLWGGSGGETSKGLVWRCQPCLKTNILGPCWALVTHKPRGATSSTDRFSVPGEGRS